MARAREGELHPGAISLRNATSTASGARSSVRLYARPACLRDIDPDALEEATSINDQPFGILKLGGETYHVAIVRTRSGRLRLNVMRAPACRSVDRTA